VRLTLNGADLTAAHSFRIKQLVPLDCGSALYRIRSEREPFDRIVSEDLLAPQR
jgi:hypothetical protein